MESDIEENKLRQMEEIEALSSIYEENFILGNMIEIFFTANIYSVFKIWNFTISESYSPRGFKP